MPKKTVAQLEAELLELSERLQKLEALVSTQFASTPSATSPAAATAAKSESSSAPATTKPVTSLQPVPREILLAISAAVAAFLGKRATIRQIHLSGSTAWAQQGRATVQASHSIQRGYR